MTKPKEMAKKKKTAFGFDSEAQEWFFIVIAPALLAMLYQWQQKKMDDKRPTGI